MWYVATRKECACTINIIYGAHIPNTSSTSPMEKVQIPCVHSEQMLRASRVLYFFPDALHNSVCLRPHAKTDIETPRTGHPAHIVQHISEKTKIPKARLGAMTTNAGQNRDAVTLPLAGSTGPLCRRSRKLHSPHPIKAHKEAHLASIARNYLTCKQ